MSQNEIVSETNYYPFGLAHKGYNQQVNSSNFGENYKFNGVELNNDMDLGLYEMDFRQYNPTIGRFTGIDALSEERYWVSPYNFGQNNPILRVDPTGLLDTYGFDKNGYITWLDDTKYFDENGNEVDRLYRVSDSGQKTTKSVDVQKGALETLKESSSDYGNYDSFEAKNNDMSSKVFEFLAENTNVEWSKIDKDNQSFIATSHERATEWGGVDILADLLYGGSDRSLYEHTHSHPKEGRISDYSGPSGFHPKDRNSGDKDLANWVKTYYSDMYIKMRVYDAKTEKYILYDNKGVINYRKKKN